MTLLIIDANISLNSPSMKGVVCSLPELRAVGTETEAWCWHCDEGLPISRMQKLPRVGDIPFIRGFIFAWLVRLRSWWRFTIGRRPRPDLIFTIAWYQPSCDIALVQFSPFDWERRQRLLGMKSLRDVVDRTVNFLGMIAARRFLKKTTARVVLCVSEAVRDDLRAVNPALNYQLLPNSYDPERFNPGIRKEFRDIMRVHHGFNPADVVFAFASAGHYRRKGFFLAVQALSILRSRFPQIRFLVIGGMEKRLVELKARLDGQYSDWRHWITFTGMVNDVERHFAASDAFLFPSYSEAFALAEIEAAACGLPLFLTRHHGSEMILEDGTNGRGLEFDAEKIAEVLAEFVDGRWKPVATNMRYALNSEDYARRLIKIMQDTFVPVNPELVRGVPPPILS